MDVLTFCAFVDDQPDPNGLRENLKRKFKNKLTRDRNFDNLKKFAKTSDAAEW